MNICASADFGSAENTSANVECESAATHFIQAIGKNGLTRSDIVRIQLMSFVYGKKIWTFWKRYYLEHTTEKASGESIHLSAVDHCRIEIGSIILGKRLHMRYARRMHLI